jgi:Icc-related predicted phosphoesterase
MKITLVSDLHLEFSDVNLTNEQDADVLILGGDIMVAQDLHDHPQPASAIERAMIANGQGLGRRQEKAQHFRDFLKRVSFQFPHVIYIAGNHEYYHGKWPDSIQYLRDEVSAYPNIYFLENDIKEIDDVVFVGATLWTDMNQGDTLTMNMVKAMLNDYRVIRDSTNGYGKLHPSTTLGRHRETLEYIRQVVDSDPTRTYVVVGHHAPSKQSTKPKYEKDFHLNGGYSSNLVEFIESRPQIKLWTHGHTHDVYDYMIGGTRVVCNPRGYEGYEDPSGWNPNLILEI